MFELVDKRILCVIQSKTINKLSESHVFYYISYKYHSQPKMKGRIREQQAVVTHINRNSRTTMGQLARE